MPPTQNKIRQPIFWALAVAWVVGITLWVLMELDTIARCLRLGKRVPPAHAGA